MERPAATSLQRRTTRRHGLLDRPAVRAPYRQHLGWTDPGRETADSGGAGLARLGRGAPGALLPKAAHTLPRLSLGEAAEGPQHQPHTRPQGTLWVPGKSLALSPRRRQESRVFFLDCSHGFLSLGGGHQWMEGRTHRACSRSGGPGRGPPEQSPALDASLGACWPCARQGSGAPPWRTVTSAEPP